MVVPAASRRVRHPVYSPDLRVKREGSSYNVRERTNRRPQTRNLLELATCNRPTCRAEDGKAEASDSIEAMVVQGMTSYPQCCHTSSPVQSGEGLES